MQDLTTIVGREKALSAINKEFIADLKWAGVELNEAAIAFVYDDRITIALPIEPQSERPMFGSAVEITMRFPPLMQILITGGGEFTPQNEGAYWKTIHASSIMLNWGNVAEIMHNTIKKRQNLLVEILKSNKL